MLPRVLSVDVLDGFRLQVRFSDEVITEVDLSEDLWGPVFEPLRDPAVFAQARVDTEGNTVVWPTGADIDPVVLHGDLPAAPPARLRVRRIGGPNHAAKV